MESLNFQVQTVRQSIFRYFDIISHLEVQPELRGGAEKPPKPKSCVGRNSPLSVNNLIDAPGRNINILSKSILTDPHWIQKFFQKDHSWMYVR